MVSPRGAGWITFAVPYGDYYFADGLIPLHIRCRTITDHRKDFCAVFDFARIGKGLPLPTIGWKRALEAKIALADCTIGQADHPVFVRVIEVSQDAQQRRYSLMRSIVRLVTLEHCPHRLANLAKESSSDGIIKLIPIVGNGKLEASVVWRRIAPSLANRDCVDEIVESSSEVVECVGDSERPSHQGGSFIFPQDDAVAGVVSFNLFGNAVWASVHPSEDFIVDGLSVFLAPRQLCASVGEV